MNNITTQWLPKQWVAAILNDDYSGPSDQEQQEIKAYLQDLNGYIACPDDESFNNEQFRIPDNGGEACDCIEVNIHLINY